MAKCILCGATTKLPNGEATLTDKWVMTEFHGPHGNKYGVYCPDHKWAEMEKHFLGLAKQAGVAS